MTTVVNVLESCCDNVHVVVCINTTCDAETEKVETSETVLTSYRVTAVLTVSMSVAFRQPTKSLSFSEE